MDRRASIGTLAGGLLAAPLAAGAQPSAQARRIGFPLGRDSTPVTPPRVRGRLAGAGLGAAEGRAERLPQFAAELVQARVSVMVTSQTRGSR